MIKKLLRLIRFNFFQDRLSPFWESVDRVTKIKECAKELKQFEGNNSDAALYRLAKRQQELLEKNNK